MTAIKICGLFRTCDIEYANEARPDWAGFIIDFPESHRNLDPAQAGQLRRMLDESIKAAGVFVDQPLEKTAASAKAIGLDVIQLHGSEDDAYIRELKKKTGLTVWKAFKVMTAGDLEAAQASAADMVLLDNGYGTGRTFDWTVADGFKRPFILAGGLTPENIPEAVKKMRPAAVDISSGVETDRLKDREKMISAVDAVRNMDRNMDNERI